MTKAAALSRAEKKLIDTIVARYKQQDLESAKRLAESLRALFSAERLSPLVHSMKARAKDPTHLRDKLIRKLRKCKETGEVFGVTPENLFEQINDLAGVRLLHLHTAQFQEINSILLTLLTDEGYSVIEGPRARAWDDEYRDVFMKMGVDTVKSERMYTSVHYIVATSTKNRRTAEIQVRTLAEELWGEVDHSMNYPHPSLVASCQEQIKVLARVTSSCTRLVDSIFFTDIVSQATNPRAPRAKKK